ncbi:MAG: hypothetical protein R2751_04970 [Bacteroidales bacterium]
MASKGLMAASTKPLILSILKEGKSYGYLIIQKVKELSGGSLGGRTAQSSAVSPVGIREFIESNG